MISGMRGLTSEELIRRAEQRKAADLFRLLKRIFFCVAAALLVLALYLPVHTWLHAHLELLLGFLIGVTVQGVPWAIDRWRWLKWFSWQ